MFLIISHRFSGRGTSTATPRCFGSWSFWVNKAQKRTETRRETNVKQDGTRWNKQKPKAGCLLLWCSEDIRWIYRTFVTAAKCHIAPAGAQKELRPGKTSNSHNSMYNSMYNSLQFYVLRNTTISTLSQNLGTGKKWHLACWTITSTKIASDNLIRGPAESIYILFTVYSHFHNSSLPNVLQEEGHQCSSFLSLTMDQGSWIGRNRSWAMCHVESNIAQGWVKLQLHCNMVTNGDSCVGILNFTYRSVSCSLGMSLLTSGLGIFIFEFVQVPGGL